MRKLVVFDLETTGTDVSKDRIVELTAMEIEYALKGGGDAWKVINTLSGVYNPGIRIDPGAAKVHGYTDEAVADKPYFTEDAAKVQEFIEGAVLVGYNIVKFDTIILNYELRRCGQPGIDMETVEEIDLFQIWCDWEPRTLAGALDRFAGKELEGAHEATADVLATIDVLSGQQRDIGWTFEKMIEVSRPILDRERKLILDEDGDIAFNFGKHRNEKAKNVPLDYLQWMRKKDFPADTMRILGEGWRSGWAPIETDTEDD